MAVIAFASAPYCYFALAHPGQHSHRVVSKAGAHWARESESPQNGRHLGS